MKKLRLIWQVVRELTGEADYARYCAHLRSRHPERPVPTESEFYLGRLKDKYARPSRCC